MREARRSGKANLKEKRTTFEIAVGADRQENRVRHSRTAVSSAMDFAGCAEVGCVLPRVRKVSAPCKAARITGQPSQHALGRQHFPRFRPLMTEYFGAYIAE